jgi:hypothetical protein
MARAPEIVAELTWAQVRAWRCARQHLDVTAPAGSAVAVTSELAGVQAQVASAAAIALAVRVEGLDASEHDALLWERRALVKTWAMRGTLHLLAADELGLWTAAQALLKPRHAAGTWLRAHGLTAEGAAAMVAGIGEALRGRRLTRAELAAAVAARVGEPELERKLGGAFGDLLKPAAFAGQLCFGPDDGRNVTFVHPEDWIGPLRAPPPEQVPRELARRYLAVHGPATREELARWFGTPSAAQAGRWIAALGEEAVAVAVNGRARWALERDVAPLQAAEPAGAARLLPAFDQLVVCAPRDEPGIVPAELRDAVYRPQGWFTPVVALDGRVVGTWRHELAGERAAITVTVREPVPRAALEADAARVGAALGREAALAVEGP